LTNHPTTMPSLGHDLRASNLVGDHREFSLGYGPRHDGLRGRYCS
jgi:hypothetical protein